MREARVWPSLSLMDWTKQGGMKQFDDLLLDIYRAAREVPLGRCCINQGRGEAVLTFTRNDMAVTL